MTVGPSATVAQLDAQWTRTYVHRALNGPSPGPASANAAHRACATRDRNAGLRVQLKGGSPLHGSYRGRAVHSRSSPATKRHVISNRITIADSPNRPPPFGRSSPSAPTNSDELVSSATASNETKQHTPIASAGAHSSAPRDGEHAFVRIRAFRRSDTGQRFCGDGSAHRGRRVCKGCARSSAST